MHSQSENHRGAILMSISMAAFVFNDTLVKTVSGEVGLYQAIFVRGLIVTLLIGVLAQYKAVLWPRLSSADWRKLALRAVAEVGSTLCFLTALFHMPLANATAILQSMPLALTLAAAVFLGVPVGWRRYSAIAVGFLGVLLIVQPTGEGFNQYSLWAVAAVGFLVLRDLSTRQMSSAVPSLFVAFSAALAVMLVGGVVSIFKPWAPLSTGNSVALASSACFIFFGYTCAVMAMRVGDIAYVSFFRYTILLWAIALGYFVFGDIPDQVSFIGIAVVTASGLYTFYRERSVAS